MLYSVVIPVYNEEGNLRALYERLVRVLLSLSVDYEIVFVDDGSTDHSLSTIKKLARLDNHIKFLSFSRNFGHEAASTAGLDKARGDVVVLMDADLQDPPEAIKALSDKWKEGYQVVYGQRGKREGEFFFKRATAFLFYRFLNLLTDVHIPLDTGDFRLMDKAVVQDLKKCREQNRFVRGLMSWLGYKQIGISYDRPERKSGSTKYGFFKLLILSLDALCGFSIVPLRIATLLGLVTLIISAVFTIVIIMQKLVLGLNIPGYALATAGMFFLGGVELLLLGVIGEYVGRIYRQVQQRPLYLVREESGWEKNQDA